MSVIVYSTSACPQCVATIRELTKNGTPHTVVKVDEDTEALAHVRALGYRQAPVVKVDDTNHWSGFRPDLLKSLAA